MYLESTELFDYDKWLMAELCRTENKNTAQRKQTSKVAKYVQMHIRPNLSNI